MTGTSDDPGTTEEDGAGYRSAAFDDDRMRRLLVENTTLGRKLNELQLGLDAHSIVAMTDRRGVILEANSKFVEISKYRHDELIGSPQSIVNSGHHPKEFFRQFWRTISQGQIWQGEICNRAKDGSLYWVATTILPLLDEDGKPERYLSIRTDVTRLRETERRVRKLAYFDPLTGLPNRAAAQKYLDEAAARPGTDYRAHLAVSFEDLAPINDAFGYQLGDQMMRVIAQRFARYIEDPSELGMAPSTVARTGTNNFGLSFSGLGTVREEADQRIRGIAARLSEKVNEVVRADLGKVVEVRLPCGYVLYRAADDLSGVEVFTRAEIARRRSYSTQGMSTPVCFTDNMIVDSKRQLDKLFDLRRGIAEDGLRMFLQPIVDADRDLRGFEALARWQDNVRGLVMPDEFIGLAEQTGLILEIGAWMIEEACRILSLWSRHESTRNLVVGVNVSEMQLRQPGFVDNVLALLERYEVRPELLKLEVTESMVHQDFDTTVEKLERLREARIEVALDDFGEGYSSLSALKLLPVGVLKIDRMLVMDIAEDPVYRAIVRMIVELAHLMGLRIVAEGVETEEQFSLLREMGVDWYQGYLFGRPEQIDPEHIIAQGRQKY